MYMEPGGGRQYEVYICQWSRGNSILQKFWNPPDRWEWRERVKDNDVFPIKDIDEVQYLDDIDDDFNKDLDSWEPRLEYTYNS